jgi:lipid-binding SYLF domain-containing protein
MEQKMLGYAWMGVVMRIRNVTVSFLAAVTMLMAETAQDRLKEATEVFTEIMGTREKGIPEELIGKANCIVIIPGMKSGAIGIGGKYGRGYAMCRNKSGMGWGGERRLLCASRAAVLASRSAGNPPMSLCW